MSAANGPQSAWLVDWLAAAATAGYFVEPSTYYLLAAECFFPDRPPQFVLSTVRNQLSG